MSVDIDDDIASEIADQVVEKMGHSTTLESITPSDAVNEYFEIRDFDNPSTVATQKSSLNFFVEWCEDVVNIQDMNNLTGSDLSDYRIWRREEAPEKTDSLAPKTEQNEQKIIRKFIEYCEKFDAVEPGLHHQVVVPKINEEDEICDDILDSERAGEILDYLGKYEYATIEHVVWVLFAETGARTSGIHSLDVDDYVDTENPPHLDFCHRPDEGTYLKNGKKGERKVAISPSVCEVLDDYLEHHRPDVVDDHGRQPLLASKEGRLGKSTIRKYTYMWSRPCMVTGECPYGRDEDDCEATQNDAAYKCPGSLSCHPVRKGYITQELRAGVTQFTLADRCNVSEAVLEKHYDKRSEKEKMEARQEVIEAVHREETGYGQ